VLIYVSSLKAYVLSRAKKMSLIYKEKYLETKKEADYLKKEIAHMERVLKQDDANTKEMSRY
jgi:hypothetical protein